MAGRLQSIQARHGNVQQHHIRLQLGAGVQGLFAILGLSHYLHAGQFAQQPTQSLARQWLIVGNHHFQAGFLTARAR